MERHGAAIMLLEENTDAQRLADRVIELAADPLQREKMEAGARQMSTDDAAEQIAGFAWELLNRKIAC
jgi:UDP-N-acetylglucosamine:LPS N-acetylglucosamine transferase